jgi:hypothetical protein
VFGTPGFETPPTPVEGMMTSGPSGIVYEGFSYPMGGDLTVRGDRLVFDISPGDIWADDCAKESVFANPGTTTGFSCVPPGDVDFFSDGNCAIGGQPFGCDPVALCAFLGACRCTASGCGADPSQIVHLELTLAGTALSGSVKDVPPGETHEVELTRR